MKERRKLGNENGGSISMSYARSNGNKTSIGLHIHTCHLPSGACVGTICVQTPTHTYVWSAGPDRGRGDGARRLVRGGLWGCSPSIFINQAFQGAVRGSIMRVITQAGCQSYYHRDPSLEITLTLLLVK